jgi:hypothetical protein
MHHVLHISLLLMRPQIILNILPAKIAAYFCPSLRGANLHFHMCQSFYVKQI